MAMMQILTLSVYCKNLCSVPKTSVELVLTPPPTQRVRLCLTNCNIPLCTGKLKMVNVTLKGLGGGAVDTLLTTILDVYILSLTPVVPSKPEESKASQGKNSCCSYFYITTPDQVCL